MSALAFATENDRALADTLRFLGDGIERLATPGSRHYSSMYAFVLDAGRFYVPETLLLDRMEPRHCYDNALEVAAEYGYPYVEGYALSTVGVPVHHAWNADGDGVIDVTWERLGLAYLGIEFPPELVRPLRERDQSVIDNWKDGWPLLDQPWKAEA